MTIRLNSLTLSIISFVVFFVLVFFAGSTILLSPSHPFVDENGNSINDLDEKVGKYEDPAERARIYGVTFPITDLGNCGSYNECHTFCEDPVNSETCVSYGKSKGFYQDDPIVKDKDKILTEAKNRLGCDSYESCLNFCSVPTNHDKCDSFARGQGLNGGVVGRPDDKPVLDKAKEVLGCSSVDACKSFCEQDANVGKCSDFARQVGLRGGEHKVGPGGCTSESTCKSLCSDPGNFQVCKGFQEVSGGTFTGPGGCNSPESCRDYCQQNPSNCGYKPGQSPGQGQGQFSGPGGQYNPTEMCNRTPNCSWGNNGCQCGFYGETKESAQKAGEYAGFCSTNPDKCKPGQAGGFGSSEQRQEFQDFCRQNPDKCKPPSDSASPQSSGLYGGGYYGGGGAHDPAAECGRYGCSWTGSSCQCAGIISTSNYSGGGGSSNPSYSPSPGGNYTPPPGGSYTPPPGGDYHPYSGSGSYTPPPTSSGSYSGGSYSPPPGGSYTPPPSGSYTPPSGDSGGSSPAPAPAPSGDSGGSAPAPAPAPSSGDSGGGGGGGSYSPPSGGGGGGYTHGVSTQQGLLQMLWNLLQGK